MNLYLLIANFTREKKKRRKKINVSNLKTMYLIFTKTIQSKLYLCSMMKERAQSVKTNGKKSFEIIQATSNEVITRRILQRVL